MWVASNSGVTLAGNTPRANVYNGNNQISNGSYDNAGNQLSVNGFTLGYDAENRQISATEQPSLGSGQELYRYDGEGQRIEKIAPSGNTIYAFDAFGQMAAQYNTFASSFACTTCYITTDPLGSVRLVTDQNGSPVTRHDYLPFGEEIPASSASIDLDQRFTGQIRDTETGLDFFNARYYTSALGRFNSADPANAGAYPADPQTWNGYAYVRNNPLTYTDPSGLFLSATTIGAAGGGPIGATIGAVLDLFGALFGLFGGGGAPAAPPPPPPTPPVSSYPAGQTSGLPPGSWPGGEYLGLPPGVQIPGPFEVGLPNPFIFSMCSTGDPNCGSPLEGIAGPAVLSINPATVIAFSKALQHNNPNPTKGKTYGLDHNDPKWATKAVIVGVGALTLTEILEMAVGGL
jgi:RHS repeat-associated protein